MKGRELIKRGASAFGDFIQRYGRGYIKASIKEKATPYILAMQEADIGEKELRYLVNNNCSFYKDFMPAPWKEAMLDQFEGYESYFENIDYDLLLIFIEAMTDEAEWFPLVVSVDKKEWLHNELVLIREDLKCRERDKARRSK